MNQTVEAVYEHGVLRLRTPIDLPEGAAVRVVVLTESTPAPAGKRPPAEIAAELAALAVAAPERDVTGRDHDRVLYGEPGAR